MLSRRGLLGGLLALAATSVDAQYIRRRAGRPGLRLAPSLIDPVFFTDTFTDVDGTLLTAHTSDSGHTYVLHTGSATPAPTISGNRVYSAATTGAYRSTATVPSADVEIDFVIDYLSTVTADNLGVCARMTGTTTFYFARYIHSPGAWQIFKIVAGTTTQLGSNYNDTFASGSRSARFRLVGSTLSLFVDDMVTPRVTATDTAITAAGPVGIRLNNSQAAATGRQITSVVARTV